MTTYNTQCTAVFAGSTTLCSAIFGEFSRYKLVVEVTRHGSIEFFVEDAETRCPDTGADCATIRQWSGLSKVLNGLEHHFADNTPARGDWVINMDSTPGIFQSIYHTGEWVLKDPSTGQKWVAPSGQCLVIK